MYDIKFKNTHLFSPAAKYFQEHGVYTKYSEGSPEREAYWRTEERRGLYGYKAPCGPSGEDIWISGYFYWYLNFTPMIRLTDIQKEDESLQPSLDDTGLENLGLEQFEKIDYDGSIISQYNYDLIADRISDFPDYWDGDYWWYKYLHVAEELGLFGGCLKRRGVGQSFKGGSAPTRNYFLIPNSKSFCIADDKSDLIGDGILQKAWDMMNFIDKHTDFSKMRQAKDTEMHKRASVKVNVKGVEIEEGFLSEIIGITTKDHPDKVRGIRGKLIQYEEAGKNPHLVRSWEISTSSVKQQKRTFGLMIWFGTGGTDSKLFAGVKELFYHPKGYECYGIPNIWDKASEHKRTCFFWPAYINAEGFMDNNGNSKIEESKEYFINVRNKKRDNISLRSSLDRYISENPFTPEEATLNLSRNRFDVLALKQQLSEVETNPQLRHYGFTGEMIHDENGLINFKQNNKLKPIEKFPHDSNEDNTGAIVIYNHPYRHDGIVPPNLYLIAYDPYYQDQSTGPSLAAAFVYKRHNNFSKYKMDAIHAEYVGRPKTQDMYHRQLFELAKYYNAVIAYENDMGKEVLGYARRKKMLPLLSREFEFKYNTDITIPAIKRGFGMKMGSGRNNVVRNIGEQYLADWLVESRGVDPETGNDLCNYQFIYSIPLLQELIDYDSEGNFDRVDAMIIMMYHMKEKIDTVARETPIEPEGFFSKERVAEFNQHDKWY